MPDAALRRLEEAFAAPDPERGEPAARVAGVLVPVVVCDDGSLALLYTRRSEFLSSHPGEISFPGGRLDPDDAGPLAAALRETEEEVGLGAADLRVLGHVADFPTFRGVLVCAYAAAVPLALVPASPASPDEVAELLLLPLDGLARPGVRPGGAGRPFY
ncbi:MAG TPA: CoA pyrophosphatase, partial [Candidatus Thermoplasmatota archaeon]|nr:CoA pyrophosphatase [Candidatus Thermoplasmatota archaeon]